MNFKPDEFKKDFGYELIGIPDVTFEEIVTDSREAGPRKAFAAIKGKKFDGHDFIEQAYRAGSRVFFIDSSRKNEIKKKYLNWLTNSCFLYLPEAKTEEGLLASAKKKAGSISGEIVGITGSAGKTTVKEMLAKILSPKFEVFKAKKSFNTSLGISVEILNARPNADFYIFEYGISRPGDMDELLEIIKPTKVIITNIGYGHIGLLGSRQAIFEEKIKLAEAETVREVYLNADDDFYEQSLSRLKKFSCRIYSAGKNEKADLRFEILNIDEAGYPQVRFFFKKEVFDFKLSVPGTHNVSNLALASLLALKIGLEKGEFLKAVAEIRLPKMRLEFLQKGRYLIINDAYNSNPASLKSAFELLFTIKREAHVTKVAIIGDMLELGDYSEELHEEAGRVARLLHLDYVIYLGAYAEAFKKGFGSSNFFVAKDQKEAARILQQIPAEEMVVLIKGSRAMQLERVLEYV